MVNDNSHLRTIVNQDGAAVLDMKLGTIATLNATGSYVWQGLERGESLETIVINLSRDTGEQPEVVGRDVKRFVETLRARQLLSR
jgi:Coenzyme PQQ synthesis protein D (PqqD)